MDNKKVKKKYKIKEAQSKLLQEFYLKVVEKKKKNVNTNN